LDFLEISSLITGVDANMSLIDKHEKMKNISVVMPKLNESQNVKAIFPNIPDFVDEIIVVDALKSGFEKASVDLIIMMDAD
jgi:hypothetical protein